MSIKTTTLKSGITIRDARSLSCGVEIGQDTKFIFLSYSRRDGFYLISKGVRFETQDQIQAYREELEMMADAMMEANQLFNRD